MTEENVQVQEIAKEVVENAESGAKAAGAESMLPQSKVNSLVNRAKREAEEKAQAHYEQKLAEERAKSAQPASADTVSLSKQQIEALIDEKANQRVGYAKAIEIANQFESKINDAIKEDPDFADDYDALKVAKKPWLVMMTNELDNTADVIRELAQNPSKFSSVLYLANSGDDDLAKKELRKLSASIKENKKALEQKKAPAPLGQIKPSNVITGDGKPSVKSFKAQFRG